MNGWRLDYPTSIHTRTPRSVERSGPQEWTSALPTVRRRIPDIAHSPAVPFLYGLATGIIVGVLLVAGAAMTVLA